MNTHTIQDLQSQWEETLARAEQALRSPAPRLLAPTQPLPMTGFFHAITGQRLLLPPEEAIAYLRLGSGFFTDLQPVGVREIHLVQRVVDITWRLHRAAAMENNIIETETLRHAQSHNDARTQAVAAQAAAIRNDCENTGVLDTLTRYDARLNRVLRQTTDELARLQEIREKNGKPGFVSEECEALLWYKATIRQYTAEPPEQTRTKEITSIDGSLCRESVPAMKTKPPNTLAKPRQLHRHAGSTA